MKKMAHPRTKKMIAHPDTKMTTIQFRKLRKLMGWTLVCVAYETGVKWNTVHRWNNGERARIPPGAARVMWNLASLAGFKYPYAEHLEAIRGVRQKRS